MQLCSITSNPVGKTGIKPVVQTNSGPEMLTVVPKDFGKANSLLKCFCDYPNTPYAITPTVSYGFTKPAYKKPSQCCYFPYHYLNTNSMKSVY